MKIDLNSINIEHFNIKEYILNGEVVYLINPKDFGCKWTKNNLHLRSIVIDKYGEIVSLGHKKFFNHAEKSDLYPDPEIKKDWEIGDKVDGSLLVWSKFKNNLIHRTRGVIDAKAHENGYEIDYLIDKYPKLKNFDLFPKYSILTEWTSPTQKIVLDYGKEPDIILLDVINHDDFSYLSVDEVDLIAKQLDLRRPERFNFNNLSEIVENCQTLKGREGYVLAYNKNQNRIKLKGINYLMLHRFKSQATLENTIDLFFEYGCPEFLDFQTKIKQSFDEDCAELVLGFCSQICDAYKEVKLIVNGFNNFIEKHKTLTPKEFAFKVFKSYSGEKNNRTACLFTLKNKGKLTEEQEKKIIFQLLKS